MTAMPNDKTSVLTAAETSQIVNALSAGAGKPPSERELAIALKWAGYFFGWRAPWAAYHEHPPLRTHVGYYSEGDSRRSNNRSSARDKIREQTEGSVEA